MIRIVKAQDMSQFETKLFKLLKGETEFYINRDPQFKRRIISCELTKSDTTHYGLKYSWCKVGREDDTIECWASIQYFSGMITIHELPMRPAALIELGELYKKHG